MMPLRRFVCFSILLLAIGTSVSASAKTSDRVALVTGISNYAHVEKLRNPENDATAIAEQLKSLGFDVTLKVDLNFTDFRLALAEFADKAEAAEMAVIYYAGHGIEVGGKNYLIPADAKLGRARSVDFEAVGLAQVMGVAALAKDIGIVILDACRNNPFRTRMVRSGGTRSVGRGLVREAAARNTLIAYAAAAGDTAEDGTGEHSPYTTALLTHLASPGVEVRQLFGQIRDSVLNLTEGTQEPFTYGSVGGKSFFFNSAPAQIDPPARAKIFPIFERVEIDLCSKNLETRKAALKRLWDLDGQVVYFENFGIQTYYAKEPFDCKGTGVKIITRTPEKIAELKKEGMDEPPITIDLSHKDNDAILNINLHADFGSQPHFKVLTAEGIAFAFSGLASVALGGSDLYSVVNIRPIDPIQSGLLDRYEATLAETKKARNQQ